jgi:hypothetical protein
MVIRHNQYVKAERVTQTDRRRPTFERRISMANQDNLPVWAKILLGIPVNDAAPNPADVEEQVNSSKREASVAEFAQADQTITVYNPNQWGRKWSWRGAFCPATREAN